MSSRQRRRSTPLPRSPDTEAEFRNATEAMQRAADAMIAATESFRKQFHQQEINAAHGGRANDGSESRASSSGTGSSNNSGNDSSNSGTTRSPSRPSSRRRPASYQPYRPSGGNTDRAREGASALRPGSAAGLTRNATGNQSSGPAGGEPAGMSARLSPYPPAVQRPESLTPGSRNPYSMYRASRATPRSPPPSTSLPTHASLADLLTPEVPRDDSRVALTAVSGSGSQIHSAEPDVPSSLPSLPPQQHQAPQQRTTGNTFLPLSSHPVQRAEQPSVVAVPKTPESAHVPPRRLAPQILPARPARSSRSTRRPSVSSHMDLVEAASRLKQSPPEKGPVQTGEEDTRRDTPITPVTLVGTTDGSNKPADDVEPEPEPVLQIGRYTYVRSEAGETLSRGSLIRDDGSRRYTAMPPRRGSSLRHGQHQKPPQVESMGPHGFSLVHEALFVLIVCLSQVLMLAGIAQALVPAKWMAQSFPDTGPGDLAWYTAAYGLTSGTFVLPAGRLGDIFGHRRVFIMGFIWFAVWSLLAGFSPAVQQAGSGDSAHRGTIFFIVCRAMQGVGPAMLVPNGQAMLGRAYTPGKRKNFVMCLFGASAPLGFVVGAAVSSLFAVRASWPWAFWTMAAVCIALAALSMIVMPSDGLRARRQRTLEYEEDDDDDDDDVVITKKAPVRESLWVRMDALGMILGVAGLVLVNFSFNQAPIVGWSTPYTYFLLLIGLFFLAAFVYVEAVQATYPLVPLAAMRSTTNFVLGCTATGWGCFSVWVYYSVQMFENLRGWTPLKTSAAYAPAPVAGLAASLLTGFLFSKGIKPHWVMLISMFAFFVGSLLFATSPPQQLYWLNPFFSILVMPFGMDMSNPAAIILLSNSVSREHQGIAASLVVTVVNYAISLALGIAGSVEAGVFDPNDLLTGYRAAQYFGLGLGGLGVLFGTAFLCQSYLRTPRPQYSAEKTTP